MNQWIRKIDCSLAGNRTIQHSTYIEFKTIKRSRIELLSQIERDQQQQQKRWIQSHPRKV